MKKIIFSLLVLILIMPVLVQADQAEDLDQVLTEIKQTQDVAQLEEINCNQLSNDQLTEVGEAVMAVMHPDKEQRELMDRMMGGEGSDSLAGASVNMGKAYFGCDEVIGNMMSGRGMMNSLNNSRMMTYGNDQSQNFTCSAGQTSGFRGFGLGPFSMMNGSFGWLGWLGWSVQILLMAVGVIALIKYLSKKS